MVLNFYKNNTILAPVKCGTRYLKECFGDESDIIPLHRLKGGLHHKTLNTIIIRSPYEHLESALHTELLPIFAEGINTDKIESMLKTFDVNWNYPEGGTHWSSTLYEKLYFYWGKNSKKIKIIELKELSNYLNTIQAELPIYNPQKYNFNHYDNWYSKDDIILYVKENYKIVWNNLMKQIEISNNWYQLLITENPMDVKLI
jgi:hypothetical protein